MASIVSFMPLPVPLLFGVARPASALHWPLMTDFQQKQCILAVLMLARMWNGTRPTILISSESMDHVMLSSAAKQCLGKRQKSSYHMRSWAFKTRTLGIMRCAHFLPNVQFEVIEGFLHIMWHALAAHDCEVESWKFVPLWGIQASDSTICKSAICPLRSQFWEHPLEPLHIGVRFTIHVLDQTQNKCVKNGALSFGCGAPQGTQVQASSWFLGKQSPEYSNSSWKSSGGWVTKTITQMCMNQGPAQPHPQSQSSKRILHPMAHQVGNDGTSDEKSLCVLCSTW